MGHRQMLITSYLYGETPAAIFRFLEAACQVPQFQEVVPVRRSDDQVIAVAFLTEEGASIDAAAKHLAGILGRDICLATAQDGRGWPLPQLPLIIPGRSSEVRRGEVIPVRLELEVSTDG